METTNVEARVGCSENLSEVHEKYGRADLLASILGMFTALGVLAFLGALIAAGSDGSKHRSSHPPDPHPDPHFLKGPDGKDKQ